MKLLAAGDLHLGRALAGVDAETALEMGPARAWRRLVQAAVSLQVDALLLTGDIVDRDELFFEAYGELLAGIEILAAAGIRIIAVAGNHDTRALPELADALASPASFLLLGRNGTWEQTQINGRNGEQITVTGWSFPAPHVLESPLDSMPVTMPTDPYAIGLLHGDLDTPNSRYAPIRTMALKNSGIPLWLLGHIHIPTPLDGRGIYYTGSLQGLDRSETGLHGAILLEQREGSWHCSRLPIAGLRYENLGPFSPENFADRSTTVHTLNCALAAVRESDTIVQRIVATVSIAGIAEHPPLEYHQRLAELTNNDFSFGDPGLKIAAINIRISPPVDLARLATGQDLCGRLAATILHLRAMDGEHALQSAAAAIIEELNAEPVLAPLRTKIAPQQGHSLLIAAAEELLYMLLHQRRISHD